MKYRNKVTGVVIDVAAKLNGPNWEPVNGKVSTKPAKAEKVEEPKEEPKPKATKKATKRGKKK